MPLLTQSAMDFEIIIFRSFEKKLPVNEPFSVAIASLWDGRNLRGCKILTSENKKTLRM